MPLALREERLGSVACEGCTKAVTRSMYAALITTEAMSMLPTHRPPTHPGEMLLKEFLEPLGVSQVEAATRMSIPFQRLNGIVNGRRAVSAGTALLLEALTGWDAQIWLTLQAKWDLWHALRARGSRPKVRPLRQTALGHPIRPHGSASCGNRPEQPATQFCPCGRTRVSISGASTAW